jgi:hypothetical protein
LAVASFAMLSLGCRGDGTVAAASVEKGTSLAELETRAGTPSVRRNVVSTEKTDLCADDALNVKAVEYHAYDGVANVFGVFGGPPSFVVVVCLDHRDTVTATHAFHNN